MLLTRPTTKLPCQHPSTKVMHTSAHPGVLWEEPHQTQSINDDRTLTVLQVLTPLGLETSSWRSCLARQSSVSTDSFKLTVTHFLQTVYLRRIFSQFCSSISIFKRPKPVKFNCKLHFLPNIN